MVLRDRVSTLHGCKVGQGSMERGGQWKQAAVWASPSVRTDHRTGHTLEPTPRPGMGNWWSAPFVEGGGLSQGLNTGATSKCGCASAVSQLAHVSYGLGGDR